MILRFGTQDGNASYTIVYRALEFSQTHRKVLQVYNCSASPIFPLFFHHEIDIITSHIMQTEFQIISIFVFTCLSHGNLHYHFVM